MSKNIIALTGLMGSGKSTVTQLIQSKIESTSLIKFAGTLYRLQDLIYEECGLTLEGEKDRKLLQLLGTEWGREVHGPNIWVNAWKKKALESSSSLVLTDDCRFLNEAAIVSELGGVVVKIEGVQRGSHVTHTGHASEKEISLIRPDYVLDNSGSLSDLEEQVNTMLKEVM